MTHLYERPQNLDQALDLLPQQEWTLLAGGTDIYPAATEAFAWGRPAPDRILDLSALSSLGTIAETATAYRIGSLVTWSQVIESDLPDWFDCLRLAGREVGGVQIQNRGTVAGNICNASPAGDGVPALLVLDASVELRSAAAIRTLPIADFIRGNRRTDRRTDELVTAIIIPKRDAAARSTFRKLGARRYLVISIAMVAALVETGGDGRITFARVAVGACSEVAQRLHELESALIGRAIDAPLAALASDEALSALSPIGDVRGSATYRQQAATVLVGRTLEAFRSHPEVTA